VYADSAGREFRVVVAELANGLAATILEGTMDPDDGR